MVTPTLLGFAMLFVGAFVFLFTVMRAEAGADRDRRRAAARIGRGYDPGRSTTASMPARI